MLILPRFTYSPSAYLYLMFYVWTEKLLWESPDYNSCWQYFKQTYISKLYFAYPALPAACGNTEIKIPTAWLALHTSLENKKNPNNTHLLNII